MATENRRSSKTPPQPTGEETAAIGDTAIAATETPHAESTGETAALPATPARTSRPRTRSAAGASKKAAALQNTPKAKSARPRGRPRKDAAAAIAPTAAAPASAAASEAAIPAAPASTKINSAPVALTGTQASQMPKFVVPQGDAPAGHFGVDALYSIYKGRAIIAEVVDGAVASFDFLDLSAVRPEQLMFDDAVQQQITTQLWTPIVKTAECRAAGLPLKQGIVLSGLAGTGKTFTALATAKKCYGSSWTFMMVSDAAGLPQALAIAERYLEPCVVFAEDIDLAYPTVASWRTAFSGISPGAEIVTLCTTSSDHVAPSLAPGWIDSVIYLTPPSGEVVKKLIRMYGGTCLREDDQLAASSTALTGYSPAAIKLAVERCIRYAVGRASSRTKPHVTDKQIAEMAAQLSQLGPVSSFTHYAPAAETPPQTGWSSPEELRRVFQATLQEYGNHAAIFALDRMVREMSEKLDRFLTGGGGSSMVTRGVPTRAAV